MNQEEEVIILVTYKYEIIFVTWRAVYTCPYHRWHETKD